MKHMGGRDYDLWDEEDGFFYDVLRYPDGSFEKFRVRSLVGLIPLFAVERLEATWIEPFKEFSANLNWFLEEPPRSGRARASTASSATAASTCYVLDDRRPGPAAADARAPLRPRRVPLATTACAPVEVPRGAAVRARRQHAWRYEPARGDLQDQGRQLQLARADLVPDGVPDDRVAAQARQGATARTCVHRAARTGAEWTLRRDREDARATG